MDLIYWVLMAGSVIYLIATVIFPFFRFVLENATLIGINSARRSWSSASMATALW